MWWKLELSFSQRRIKELFFSLLFLICFSLDGMFQLFFLFIRDGCDFLQEYMMDVNEWITFIKIFITLIFDFIGGMCKSQDQRNNSKALQSLLEFSCIWIYISIWIWSNLNYISSHLFIVKQFSSLYYTVFLSIELMFF